MFSASALISSAWATLRACQKVTQALKARLIAGEAASRRIAPSALMISEVIYRGAVPQARMNRVLDANHAPARDEASGVSKRGSGFGSKGRALGKRPGGCP